MTAPTARDQQKAQTRARLLDAAAKVFAAKGYRGAAVDDVAEIARLTKGAVYAHFRTKEALYLALVRERGLASLAEVEAVFDAEREPDQRVDALNQRATAQLKDRDWLLLEHEFLTHAARDPKLRKELRDKTEHVRRVNAGFIQRQWDDRGITPAISAEDFDRLIDGLGKHFAQEALLDPKADLTPALLRTLEFLVRAAQESARWTAPEGLKEPRVTRRRSGAMC